MTGLLPATRYAFRVRAVRSNGAADEWGDEWSRSYATVADAPAQKVCVCGGGCKGVLLL